MALRATVINPVRTPAGILGGGAGPTGAAAARPMCSFPAPPFVFGKESELRASFRAIVQLETASTAARLDSEALKPTPVLGRLG